MTRQLIFMFCLLSFSDIDGQEIFLKTFVKNDTVQLRWAPANFEGLILGFKNGYTVFRTIGAEQSEFRIAPYVERATPNFTSDKLVAVDKMICEAIINSPSQNGSILYSLLLLSAGPDKDIAKLLGVYFEDVSDLGGQYNVRINGSSHSSPVVRAIIQNKDVNPELTKLSGESRHKLGEVYLNWNYSTLADGYSGFWVEKSTDSLSFSRLNEAPLIFFTSADNKESQNLEFVDTLVREGEEYFYRVRGINHFGDLGEISNTVRVYVPRSLFGECRIDTIYAVENARHLLGRFLFHGESDIGNLSEFALYRSDSLFSGYEKLSSVLPERNLFSFTVTSATSTGVRAYYKVAAVSKDQDSAWSYPQYFFTLDQEPPSKPTGLKGTISDSGIVSLSWLPNPDKDLLGYRVFKANHLREEFTEVTTDFTTGTGFRDTLSLRNLTSEVYYRISAVDANYNNSAYSAPVLLLKPDTIPPVPCVFTSYAVIPEGIRLSWVNSPSDDVQKNLLLRLNPDGTETEIAHWPADSLKTFDDFRLSDQARYVYRIQTSDEKPNTRISESLAVHFELGYRPAPDSLTAVVNRVEKTISLQWRAVPGTYQTEIYRRKNDGPLLLIKTLVGPEVTKFEDSDLSINNRYMYCIKVVLESGVSSKLSLEIGVDY